MVNEWQKGCSHLVMEALSFTVKVIYALATCCPIVTPSFFDDLVKAIDSKSELPLPEKLVCYLKLFLKFSSFCIS
jgi:nijmegen breakage syndrome protein 1